MLGNLINEIVPYQIICLLLLLDKLLASLNNDTLVFLTYLLTSEIVSRSISVSCIGCDVGNASSFFNLLGHQNLRYIVIDLSEESLYGVSFTIS